MADDIDIEEHNVMDNPLIKNIFPDITSIKVEVEDYKDEESVVFEEEDHYNSYHRTTSNQTDDNDYFDTFQSKIILGTKPSTSSTPEPTFQNKIILGSKARSTDSSEDSDLEDDPKLNTAAVVLSDWGSMLANNPCFCQPCQILFPTVNALDFHKMSTHSFLVAVRNNRAIKSTSKGSLSGRIKVEPCDNRQHLICNHCNEIFPNEIALIKHTYELLPGKFECDECDVAFDSDAGYKSHVMQSHADYILCPICSCHFRFIAKLLTHMSNNHGTRELGTVKRVNTTFECHICASKLKDAKGYNLHITNCHAHLYTKRSEDVDSACKFKCAQCNLSFFSDYALRIHIAAQHSNEPNTKVDENGITQIHTQNVQVPNFKSPKHIPKQVLFKCNKCQIHFVTCTIAVEHSKRCNLTKGDWKCQKCRRTFTLADRLYHNLQHEMTEKFRIYETSSDILSRLLCECKTCSVCFDERSLLSYHADGCSSESSSIQCNDCCKRIHVKAFATHRKLHTDGMVLSDFLIVNYVPIDQSKLKAIPETNSDSTSDPDKKLYFYCPTCKCFMRRNRKSDKHSIGKCNSQQPKVICKLCGLRFTSKAFLTHKLNHKNDPDLKLSDLKFENMQTNKKINPPFPEFKKCKRCHVHFCSPVALNNHACNSEEPKICVYCGDKFSDLAFNLHVPFHEYSGKPKNVINEKIPELIKKYESLRTVWNILFLCQTCDIASDSYDKAVEHSQDHFSNMESYNVNIKHCRRCNLNFVDDCYTKHEELHLSGEIHKDSFKILVYKYDTLLSESWLDIFLSLTKEQVDLILSKSMYKYTRRARMRIVIEGPAELTLYQCGVCEVIVPTNKVAEHTQVQDKCIENYKKFSCAICSLLFASKNHKEIHEKLHGSRVHGENSYRIIQFVADKQLNDSDDPKGGPEELKFIRCQHCGKLINKAKYRKHMYHHFSYIKRSKKVVTMQKLKKSDNTANIVHKYYVCKNCKLCVTKPKIPFHKCGSIERKIKCPKCSLWLRHKSFESHERYHSKHPFTTNNMCIVYFKNGKIVKERRIKLNGNKLILYECVNCSVCVSNEVNMKRHVCRPNLFRVTCSYCHLTFHCSFIRAHKQLHETNSLTNVKFYVYKFENGHAIQGSGKVINASGKTADAPAKPENIVKSKVEKDVQHRNKRPASSLSNNSEGVRKKQRLNLRKTEFQITKKINFELSHRDYRRHIAIRYYKCSICDLIFVTCSALMVHEKTCKNDSQSEKCDDCGLVFHESMIHIHKSFQRCKERKLCELGVVRILSKGKNHHIKYNWMYLCRQCDIYNISFVGMMAHIGAGHKYGVRIDECDKCNIRLSCISYGFHRRLHHGRSDVPFSDLTVATVESAALDKPIHSELVEERQPNIGGNDRNAADSATHSIENDKSDKLQNFKAKTAVPNNSAPIFKEKTKRNDIGIFNCDICNINFVNRSSLGAHKVYGLHNEKQHKCCICNLLFTSISLKRHVFLHHKDVLNNGQHTGGQTQESSFNANDKIAGGDTSAVVDTSSSTNAQENRSTTDQNSNKLFKCDSCNIYFLTAKACYEHASPHTALDPTEFIACKICDLQFLCENLGQHMKCHRDKTFSMDDLIVTEYQAVDGKVKMDTYLAVDRLKSKLVSTTTHFDVEDQKVEALVNYVDSTTDHVGPQEVFHADVETKQVRDCDDGIDGNSDANNDTCLPNCEADSEMIET